MRVWKKFIGLVMAMLIVTIPAVTANGYYDNVGNITTSSDVQTYLNMASPIISVTTGTIDTSAITYQWYVNNSESTEGGVPVTNATLLSYPVPTNEIGTKYYYCILTSKVDNTSRTSDFIAVNVLDNSNIEPSNPIFVQAFQITEYSAKVNSSVTLGFPIEQGEILGEISYKWYSNAENSTNGAIPLQGENDFRFSPTTSKPGITYYYCIATNSLNGKEKSTVSSIVKFQVTGSTASMPQMPVMYLPYDGIQVYEGDANANLHANVNISDSGKLTLQWYKNTVNSTEGAVAIEGATSQNYKPDYSTPGTIYYFFRATNTLNDQSVSMISNIMHCVVMKLPNTEAVAPIINMQPGNYSGYTNPNGSMIGFGVSTNNAPGILTFQWYSNTIPSIEGATKLDGGTSMTFSMPTDKIGLMYYFCVATNTIGESSAAVASNIVFSKVIAPNTSLDQYGLYVIVNEKQKCTVASDFIYKDSKLNFQELNSETEEYNVFVKNISSDLAIIKAMDVTMVINDQETHVQGKYLIAFSVGSEYEGKELLVYHNNGSSIEELKGMVKNGQLTVQTSSFSPFAIAIPKTEMINVASNFNENSPKTSDSSPLFIYFGCMGAASMILMFLKKAKKNAI